MRFIGTALWLLLLCRFQSNLGHPAAQGPPPWQQGGQLPTYGGQAEPNTDESGLPAYGQTFPKPNLQTDLQPPIGPLPVEEETTEPETTEMPTTTETTEATTAPTEEEEEDLPNQEQIDEIRVSNCFLVTWFMSTLIAYCRKPKKY